MSFFDRYIVNNEKFLHKAVRKDDKFSDVLVAPQALIKYVLHHAHDVLGHNVTGVSVIDML